MKKLIIILFIICPLFELYSQDTLVYSTTKNTYIITKSSTSPDHQSVQNSNNKLSSIKPDFHWDKYINKRSQFEYIKNGFLEACRQVWGSKIPSLVDNNMSIGVVVNSSGFVCELTFYYKKELPILIEELEELEELIVNKLKIPLPLAEKQPFDFISMFQPVRFRDLM